MAQQQQTRSAPDPAVITSWVQELKRLERWGKERQS
jgi:hypothetical protein